MIGRWLRWRWWDFEDFLTGILDWQPRPEPPIKPLPPAPAPERHHVPFHFTTVSMERADPQSVDAEWTASIMRQIASGKFFQIEYL